MSSSSDISGSSYTSSGEPITCLHTAIQQSHAGQSELGTDLVQLLSRLKPEEKSEILAAMETVKSEDISVYPKDMSEHLKMWNPGITNLKSILKSLSGWMYIAESSILVKSQTPVCDIFIFTSDCPVKVISLSTKATSPDEAQRHNSLLAKGIVGTVQKTTPLTLSVIHGIAGEDIWKNGEKFQQQMEKMERDCRSIAIPGTMDMSLKRHQDITRVLLKMCPSPDISGSSYTSSEAPVTCLHTTMQQFSIGETDREIELVHHLSRLDVKERLEILDAAETNVPEMKVYPKDMSQHLKIWKPGITNLKSILTSHSGWMYIAESLKSQTPVCDIFIFTSDCPVKVISLSTKATNPDEAQRHNSLLAKGIVGTVQKATPLTLSVIHGIAGEDIWKNGEKFQQQMEKMEKDCQSIAIPGTMDMDLKKHQDITRVLLQMMPKKADESYEGLKARYEEQQTELRRLKSENKVLKWKQSLPDVSNFEGENSDSDDASQRSDIHGMPQQYGVTDEDQPVFIALTYNQRSTSFRSASSLTKSTDHETGEADSDTDDIYLSSDSMALESSEHMVEVFDHLITNGSNIAVTDNKGETMMHLLCSYGDVTVVEYLIKKGVFSVNCRGRNGRTPVLIAARHGHRKLFDLLLNLGCDLSVVDDNTDGILNVACLSDNVDFVKYLLSLDGADVNVRGKQRSTPAMIAASKGNRRMFELLVFKGCDLSAVNKHNDSILHVACSYDNVDFVQYLLTLDVYSVHDKGCRGRTPIMSAASRGCRKVFDLIRDKGGYLYAKDNKGDTILHLASSSRKPEFVEYLLTLGIVDINARGYRGRSPVLQAAAKGSRPVFQVLMNTGCDLTPVDDNENSLLHCACQSGNVDLVKYLLQLNVCDINTKGHKGRTAVMQTAAAGLKQLFDLLMEHGADLSVKDDAGSNILHIACHSDKAQFVEHVLAMSKTDINSRGEFGRTPVMIAANNGCREVFDLLVKKGCDVSLVDNNNSSILNVACLEDNPEFVDHLINLNFCNINFRGHRGYTPVMQAASKGCKRVFDLLVRKRCDLSVVSDDDDTILHAACLGGNIHIVEHVLPLKKDVINSPGQRGKTPVMIAALKGHRKVFDTLIKKEVDLTLIDNEGANILHLACAGGNVQIVEYLLSLGCVDIKSKTNDGHTPAQVAEIFGRQQVSDLMQTHSRAVSQTLETRL